MAGDRRPIKELHIKRRDGKPLVMHNYRGEMKTFGVTGTKIAGAFQGQYSVQLSFDKGFSLVLPGTGEIVPMEDLYFDILEPYAIRVRWQGQERPAEPSQPADDDDSLPF